MKNLLLVLALLTFSFCFGQLEPKPFVTVGGSGDYTNQPFVPQAKFSRTQTLYYPEQIKFNGEITGLRFFTAFSNPTTSPAPNTSIIVKIGHTTKQEFEPGDGFIPDSELTQVGIITYYANAYEWILVFDQSFTYNGVDNLVIDIEDVNPAMSSSALAGWQGTENFGNPPTRSRVSITEEFSDGSTQTSISLQNSFAKTRFDGNLQVCTGVSVVGMDNITNTSGEFTVNENPNANHYRYVITELGDAIPETYQITTQEQFTVSGLQPATDYQIHVKSDCDAFGVTTGYNSYNFRTRPNQLTIPYIIDFEGGFNDDYTIPSFGAEINGEAANNSSYGLMLNGPGYPTFLNWNEFGDPYEENQGFIRTFSMDVDLTQNTISPVLRFDVNQTAESYLRVKIKPYADDSVYTGIAEDFTYNASNTENDFNTVTINLSDFVGEVVTIKLEHVSRSTTRKTYLDNIKLEENACQTITNIMVNETTDAITLSWDATNSGNYELAIAGFEDYVGATYSTTTANSFTFSNLEVAKPYKLFVRNKCVSGDSPWQRIYASTNPNYLPVGFDQPFNNATFSNGYFSVINSESSNADVISYFLSNVFTLYQRFSNAEWVGDTSTTEAQAWDDNSDFLTGLKFVIDGSSISSASISLDFKMFHHYSSVPNHSWFRIMVNGAQYGASYNPTTKNSDPNTIINIDLDPYLGGDIEIELQQVGRYLGDFSLGTASGDGTALFNLSYNATLSVDEFGLDEFQIYPNPSKDYVMLEGLTGFGTISIFDANGRCLNKMEISTSDFSLDISNLSKGVYFIEIKFGESKVTKKFIKN